LSYLHCFFGNAQLLPKEQMQNLKEARFMRAFSFFPHRFPASLKVG